MKLTLLRRQYGLRSSSEKSNQRDYPGRPSSSLTSLHYNDMTKQTITNRTALQALRALNAAGFEAYLVGGYTRDLLLGREPHDIDVTTNARPEQIKAVFAGCSQYDVGQRFGTIGVLLDGERVEITTYRSEAYNDGTRKPDVMFSDSLYDDLARRDFTINAIAMGADGAIVDPFDGQADLQQRMIRAVGDARTRFSEDPLRLMRLVRFAQQFQAAVEAETKHAARLTADRLATISIERRQEELNKMLLLDGPSAALCRMLDIGLMVHVIPELLEQVGVQQSYPHSKDVFTHTMIVVDNVPATLGLRYGALLHDIAKPRTKSITHDFVVHFYNHENVGAEMALDIMRRLKHSTTLTEDVAKLVRMHMRANTYEPNFSNSAVRRFVRDAGDSLDDLLTLSRADITGQQSQNVQIALARVRHLEERAKEVEIADVVTAKSPLNGHEIMELLGIGSGIEVGFIMKTLERMVIDGELGADDKERSRELAAALQDGNKK